LRWTEEVYFQLAEISQKIQAALGYTDNLPARTYTTHQNGKDKISSPLAQFQRSKGWRNRIKDDLLSESNVQQAVGKIWESIFGDYMGAC
jgi:hypothetical protein